MWARRSRYVDLTAPLLSLPAVCALLLASAPALAARGHAPGATFAGPGSGNGQLSEPDGVAVNEATGDLYVVDKANDRVEWFAPNAVTKGYEYAGQINGSGTLAGEGKEAGSGGGPDEELTGKFEEPEGIAIDNDPSSPSAGDVYVDDTSGYGIRGHKVIDKYTATGKYVGQITAQSAAAPEKFFLGLNGVAVDPRGEVWVADEYRNSEDKNQVGVDNFTNAEANQLIAFRVTPPVGFRAPGLAVGCEDDLYELHSVPGTGPAEAEFRVEKRNAAGELLEDPLDEQVSSGVAVECPSDDVYVDNVASVARFGPGGALIERLSVPGMHGSGVAADAATGRVFVADSLAGVVREFEPEPPGPPTVEAGSDLVSEVKAESAEFGAEVNPRSESGEAATSYRFEYITEASYRGNVGAGAAPFAGAASTPAPEGQLVANYEPDVVSAEAEGLRPGTVYRYRVVAHNRFDPGAPVEGEEGTFTTESVTSSGGGVVLPDGRGWELVSPPEKEGALFAPIGPEGLIQASAEGNGVSYTAYTPIESDPRGYANTVQVLSKRTGGGWSSQDISLPHVGPGEGASFRSYAFFSENLSVGVVQPEGPFDPAISNEASNRTPYLRDDAGGGYAPLVTGCPEAGEACARPVEEHADVPAGTVFSDPAIHVGKSTCCFDSGYPAFLGASPDGGHVVLRSPAALTEGAPVASSPLEIAEEDEGSLYEWSAGKPPSEQLALVSVLPESDGGGPAPVSSQPLLGRADPAAGYKSAGQSVQGVRNAVSSDGSRVVWSESAGKRHLYLRDLGREETVQLDTVQKGASGKGPVAPVFQTASMDDSRVFFTDEQQLTENSGPSGPVNDDLGPDLYECQIVEEAEKLHCDLSDLTPVGAGGEPAEVRGAVIGASEDGSYVYFVANGVLGDGGERGATQGHCVEGAAVAETCNLYVAHYDGSSWTTSFIAVLSSADEPDWGNVEGKLTKLTARVSPNGEWLAFMSERRLTGYDNEDVASKRRGESVDEEVYLYNTGSGGAGSLRCASCAPTGARPAGVKVGNGSEGALLVNSDQVWEEHWLAATVPSWTSYEPLTKSTDYQSRYLSNSGRLFFDGHDGLVPQGQNGEWDVYEYEPAGVPAGEHACSSASDSGVDVFKAAHPFVAEGRAGEEPAGCVGLVSSPSAGGESAFLDASETGGDVFFLTSAKLSPEDVDTSVDVYDAHECTSASPCVSSPVAPPECENESSCKASPSPQPGIYGPPASATFNGPGNPTPAALSPAKPKPKPLTRAQKLAKALKACHAKQGKRRKTCERAARAKYGAKAGKAKKRGVRR